MSDTQINIFFKELMLKEKKQLELLISSKPIIDIDSWLFEIILECKNTANRCLQSLLECASNTISHEKDVNIFDEILSHRSFFCKYLRYVTPWGTYVYDEEDIDKIKSVSVIYSAQKLQTYMNPRYTTVIYSDYPRVIQSFDLIPLDVLQSELQVYNSNIKIDLKLSQFMITNLFVPRATISHPKDVPSFVDNILDSIDFKFNYFIEQYDKANHTIEYADNKSISYLCLAYLKCLYEKNLYDTNNFSRDRNTYDDSLYAEKDCDCDEDEYCECEAEKEECYYLEEYEALKGNSIKLFTNMAYNFNKGE